MSRSAANPAEGPAQPTPEEPPLISIADRGDIILVVTFETSDRTIRRSQRAAARSKIDRVIPAKFQSKTTIAYRVSLDALRSQSKYFANLFTNSGFHESRLISAAHANLAAKKIKPGDADASDLPTIRIVDDDEATQVAGRDTVFEDVLRIMHQRPIGTASNVVMSYVTTLAIMADRFDCVTIVSRALSNIKFKWPLTESKPYVDEAGRVTEVERVLRQRILVAWLLNYPMQLRQASRELVIRGSRLWGTNVDEDGLTGAWWNLPEGIEEELQHRRDCILNTISSIQMHFLTLYSSRERQCSLGYDSSAACDSFQLGQMLRFLLSKGMLFLVDFAPASWSKLSEISPTINITELLSTLKQCPNYQLDGHHKNCGLRIRIDPILDYIRSMLSSHTVAISYADWKKERSDVSWVASPQYSPERVDGLEKREKRIFAFTRAIGNAEKLRYEGGLFPSEMARGLFTADKWNWTPES